MNEEIQLTDSEIEQYFAEPVKEDVPAAEPEGETSRKSTFIKLGRMFGY